MPERKLSSFKPRLKAEAVFQFTHTAHEIGGIVRDSVEFLSVPTNTIPLPAQRGYVHGVTMLRS